MSRTEQLHLLSFICVLDAIDEIKNATPQPLSFLQP